MLFALICTDKPGSRELRQQHRPAHLTYLRSHADQLVYAGPLLDGDDGGAAGSLLVIDVPDRHGAEIFAAEDPYARAGLFAEVSIKATKQVFPK